MPNGGMQVSRIAQPILKKSEDLIYTAEKAWNHAIWNSELDRDEWRVHVLVALSPIMTPGTERIENG